MSVIVDAMKLFVFVLLVFFASTFVEGVPSDYHSDSKCDIFCTADYNPVCGAVLGDGSVKPRLFSNACTLKAFNCRNKSNYVKVNINRCENRRRVLS